jgi:hypothetical protein
MSFDDSQSAPNDPQAQAPVAPASANAPTTPASPSTAPGSPAQGANDTQQPQNFPLDGAQQVSNASAIAKRGAQDPNAVSTLNVAPHPLVQKAGILHSVARALAGNPTRTIIDPDGSRREVPVPLTGKQIGLAIAIEALTGSLAGLQAGRGKGVGAAGMAGLETVRQQTLQAHQRQEQNAQTQFEDKGKALAQQASAYAANLRTRALAQEVGMRDEQSHKDWIASHASTVAYLRDAASAAIIKDNAPESEVTSPEFTRQALQNGWTAIPVGYVPRYDAEGNHFSKDGVPLHDNLYMVVDNRKITVPADIVQKAQDWKLPGFAGLKDSPTNLSDFELRIGTILDTSNKIASLELEQKDLNDYYSYLNSKGVKGANGQPLVAPDLKQAVRQNAALLSYIVGPWQNHFGETPSAALKAMKDALPAKGPIANLYGGKELLDRYDLLKDIEKKGAEETTAANVEIDKEKRLVPVKAATVAAEAKAKAAATATSSRNDDGSWNVTSIPVSLVEGRMDPSQLSKRSADYNQKLQDANAYSLQKYGKPFDIAQATTDYKQANNPQVQNMLKMVAAMSAPNGELAIAVNASKALPQLNSSLANKVFNIAETQFGSDAVTNFHTAMIGFSDLYAKVMGGGVGTDALRQSAMDVLKDGYSHGQLAGSIKVLQQQIEARKSQMIGENPYLRKQFGGSAQNPNLSSAQAPPVALLKESVITTFANGQTWTLQGGQPVQVNK